MGLDRRGESEVIGTLLMALVIVALVTLIGVFGIIPLATGDVATPTVDLRVTVTPDATVVHHDGGDRIQSRELDLIIARDDGTRTRVTFSDLHSPTFADGDAVTYSFLPGEQLNPGDRVQVLIVHRPSSSLLFDGRKFAQVSVDELAGRLIWSTAIDWDSGTLSKGIVHDDVGQRLPNRLQLGYSASAFDDPGLVGYYPFDEREGIIVQDATALNDGSLLDDSDADYVAYQQGIDGVFGGTAYAFDPQVKAGEDGRYEKGAFVDLGTRTSSRIADGSFTWMAWVKIPEDAGDKDTIIATNPAASRNNNVIWFVCKTGGCEQNTDSTEAKYSTLYDEDRSFHIDRSGPRLNDKNWHHVALVFDADADTVTFYVDGIKHGVASNRDATIDADDTMSLGQDYDRDYYNGPKGTSDFFTGVLDEVRVYDRALTGTDVAQLYDISGTYVSGAKQYAAAVTLDDSALTLESVEADPDGGSITVDVEARIDGAWVTVGDPITVVAGTNSYTVDVADDNQGKKAAAFRLRVSMASAIAANDPGAGPTVDRIDLRRTD